MINRSFLYILLFLMTSCWCVLGGSYNVNSNHNSTLSFTASVKPSTLSLNSNANISFELFNPGKNRMADSGTLDIYGNLSDFLLFLEPKLILFNYPYASYCYMKTNSNGTWHISCSNLNYNDNINFTCVVCPRIPEVARELFIAGLCTNVNDNYTWEYRGLNLLTKNINKIYIYNNITKNIITEPINTDVTIDKISYGKTPTTVTLSSGNHHMEFTKIGYDMLSKDVTFVNNAKNFSFRLERSFCNMTLFVSPQYASVSVDNSPLPEKKKSVEQYISHKIFVAAEGYDPNTSFVTPTTKELSLEIDLKEKSQFPTNTIIDLLLLIVAIVTAIVIRDDKKKERKQKIVIKGGLNVSMLTAFIIANYNKLGINLLRFFKKDEQMKNDAIQLYKTGKYDDAMKKLDKATEINSYCKESWYYKGLILIEQGSFIRAKEALDKATTVDRQYAEAWERIGFTLYNQGKHDEAVMYYNKAIEINPKCALAWFNKGIALNVKGNSEEAEAAFIKARELGCSKSGR